MDPVARHNELAQDQDEPRREHQHGDRPKDEQPQFLLGHCPLYVIEPKNLIVPTTEDGVVIDTNTTSGRRVVLIVYAAVIGIAGVMGAILGIILPEQKGVAVATLGPVTFPITPATFALYGMLMMGVMLGVLLVLVQYVSRFDEASRSGE
ncbi:MAG: hypothetical protein ACI9PP_000360 [Halobacteriales archaeon]